MFTKLTAYYFAATGFFLVSTVSLARGADLLVSLKRGSIALFVCWLLGYFCSLVFFAIVADGRSDNEQQPANGVPAKEGPAQPRRK